MECRNPASQGCARRRPCGPRCRQSPGTGLTLSFVANGLVQKRARGAATEEEKKACDWLLASVFMQLSIAVALCMRIILSTLDIRSAYFDVILVWSFLVTLVAWGYIFITSYYKHR